MQEQIRHKDGIIARLEEEKNLLASKSEIYNSGRFKVVYIISARYRSYYALPSISQKYAILTFEIVSMLV